MVLQNTGMLLHHNPENCDLELFFNLTHTQSIMPVICTKYIK
jgi:hypothetical protein